MRKGLEGIKILDFTWYAAGPYCTLLLGFYGAEIIKVEAPGRGDMYRIGTTRYKGTNYLFALMNANKKSVTLNLKSEKGKEMAKEMAKHVDVVAENFAPGTMDKWGIGYEVLKKINPGIIYASVNGFGRKGPYSSYPAYDGMAQAMSGSMSSVGFPDRPPVKHQMFIADYSAGIHLAFGILLALRNREKTGKGCWVNASLLDVMVSYMRHNFHNFHESGRVLERIGNRQLGVAPFNTYETKDGYVLITGGWLDKRKRDKLLKTIGREDLIGSEEYEDNRKRWKNRVKLDAIIEAWTKTKTSKEVFEELLYKCDIASGKVLNEEEVLNDPHLLVKGMIKEMDQPGVGRIKMVNSPIEISNLPITVKQAPALGEHNEEVYSKLLGYDREDILQLKEEGTI